MKKVAFLIDREAIGGGCENIRRKSDKRMRTHDECRTFYSEKGECRARTLDAWGADEVVVNHLKALLQLLWRPWERPRGRVRFVVHGIHLRKYQWMMRETAAKGLVALPRMGYLWMCLQARRMLEQWLYHCCDEIVALTETDRADVLRLYGRNLNVVVEPNTLEGWTPRLAEGSELWTRLTQSLHGGSSNALSCAEQNRPRYVCFGRFNYQKGQDRWIRHLAASSASRDPRSASPDLSTLFVGDGVTLESCKKLAVDLGVAEQCVFAGEIPEADRYLKSADIVVSASRWEGMPYLLMKARALGCRILATDCPGNRDVLAGYEKWEKLVL